MDFDLTGKAVKHLRLPTVGYDNSAVSMVAAQQGDSNSRVFMVSLYDDRGDIDLFDYNVATLYATLPDGTKQSIIGEISKPYNAAVCKVENKILTQVGKVSCDVCLTGVDSSGNTLMLTSRTFFIIVSPSQRIDN